MHIAQTGAATTSLTGYRLRLLVGGLGLSVSVLIMLAGLVAGGAG